MICNTYYIFSDKLYKPDFRDKKMKWLYSLFKNFESYAFNKKDFINHLDTCVSMSLLHDYISASFQTNFQILHP